jgi:DNA-binding response OmpR family regulator/curved DNA-binding protein CbpA
MEVVATERLYRHNIFMDKNDLLIMIVEDDANFSKALKTAIEQEGYQVKAYTNATDCIAQHKLNPPDLMLVDCLLPGMPGVEMVVKIHKEDVKTPVILMSGIFTDKSFIKDALTKTNALGFLSKPFENKILIEQINSILLEKTGVNIPPIEQIYQKSSLAPKEITSLISSVSTVHGYHLPKLFLSLLKSNESVSLDLKDEETLKTSTLRFSQGRIVEVKVEDPNSYFGRLMVEKNFLSPEELETILAKPSNKKIGEKLIDENLISPHMVDLVNSEQMCLRLGRLIRDTNYELNLQTSTASMKSDVDSALLTKYVVDWTRSKYELSWLNKFYTLWMNSSLIIEKSQKVLADSLLKHLDSPNYNSLLEKFSSGSSLQEVLNQQPHLNDQIFLLTHMLTSINYIYFDQNVKSEEQSLKFERVKQLLEAAEKQDHFQVLGLTRRAKTSDIKKSFHDLAKTFHPDKLSKSTAPEVVKITKDFFTKITLAYETLADSAQKEIYMKELETGQAQLRLQAESLFEEAKELMGQRQYIKAKELMIEASQLCPPTSELKLHILWVILALGSQSQDNKELAEVSENLNRVPPEDRHNAIYYFVKGLLQKQLGQLDLAKGNIAHAVSIQPNFVEAKRELNVLNLGAKNNKPVDILNADLKDVVGSLFKKKR